jgi:adenosylcobyric acid synthase
MGSQVIVRGKSVGNYLARDYYEYKKELAPVVKECFERLCGQYDVVVLEGAGSAVELNLREHDLVNLNMAEMADAPCILVGDIDRGGIFASLIGSVMLMSPNERKRIIGFMVNKLRGDPALFTSGIDILEKKGGRPVLGVIPHFSHIAIPEEDSVALGKRMKAGTEKPAEGKPSIGVVRLPFVSNYTDFDCFEQDPGVELAYFDKPGSVFHFDAVIIPGSKNTIEDLDALRRSGMADALVAYHKAGGSVVGLCGGYQMLGKRIADPHGVESSLKELPGLGLLDMETEMFTEKITTQVEARLLDGSPLGAWGGAASEDERLYGYEIHMGRSRALGAEDARPGNLHPRDFRQ